MLDGLAISTRWRDAAIAFAAGDLIAAAETLAEIGSRPDEAYARLRAAEEGAGDEQASRALECYRPVGATMFVRRAARLFPATA